MLSQSALLLDLKDLHFWIKFRLICLEKFRLRSFEFDQFLKPKFL